MLNDFDFGQLASTCRAVLFDQLRDVVAAKPPAGFALDREGGDAEIREGVGVIAHGSGFRSGRLLHNKVAGTASTNCAPATRIDAFVGGTNAGCWLRYKPGRPTSDNRGLTRSFPA
jgi:hypothetical protein